MLSIEKRQSLTSLLLLGEIQSISVNDFDYGSGLGSAVTIHVKKDVERKDILNALYSTVGAIAEEKEPHEPDGGKQVFPYYLYIEGADNTLSTLFFTESQIEKPSTGMESNKENLHLHNSTEETWLPEDIVRQEA